MTNRLCTSQTASFADEDKYARLIAEALVAFEHDVVYAVQVAESASHISARGRKVKTKRS